MYGSSSSAFTRILASSKEDLMAMHRYGLLSTTLLLNYEIKYQFEKMSGRIFTQLTHCNPLICESIAYDYSEVNVCK